MAAPVASALPDTVTSGEATAALPGPVSGSLLALICLLPLVFSAPSLADPFGQTEEAVNATIWGLGGRNLIEKGPVAAKLGALVAPYPGTGGGVYAHHPPLPVWVSAALQLVGPWEWLPRLFALLCVATALFLMQRLLEIILTPPAALLGTSLMATSAFILTYGRLGTTLTLATPLHAGLCLIWARRAFQGRPWRWPLLALIVLSVLSSWDGVLAAGAVIVAIAITEIRDSSRPGRFLRAAVPAFVGLVSLGALLAYLVWANGGPDEILRQAVYRSGMSPTEYSMWQWVKQNSGFVANGLGPLSALLLLVAPVGMLVRRDKVALATLAMLAVPGLGMTLGMQQGAYYHAFWSYNLVLPLALAAGWAVDAVRATGSERFTSGFLALCLVQLTWNARISADQLDEEHGLNSVGALTRDLQPVSDSQSVAMLSAYAFHPYTTWYLRGPMDVALQVNQVKAKLDSGEWAPQKRVLVDSVYSSYLGCRSLPAKELSANRRWAIVEAGELLTTCQALLPP